MATGQLNDLDPNEFAARLFDSNILPWLRHLNRLEDLQKSQLYGTLLASIFGSMAADFGHEKALSLMRLMTDVFAGVGDKLEGSATQ